MNLNIIFANTGESLLCPLQCWLAPSYFLPPKSNQKPLGGFKCEAVIEFKYRAGGNQPPRPPLL